jgi:hypothetical protein
VVVVGNAFSGFTQAAVATGRWSPNSSPFGGGEFKPVTWNSTSLSYCWDSDNQLVANPDSDFGAHTGEAPWGGNRDQRRGYMHRHWYVADNVIRGYGAKNVYLTFTADSDVAYNRLSGCEPARGGCLCPKASTPVCSNTDEYYADEDAIFLDSCTNIDVYGNDIRDFGGNAFRPDWSYSNIRIWRNRAIDSYNSFINLAPMDSAPWYIVRNEYVGAVITSELGKGAKPLHANVFDRLVLINNTFVTRKSNVGLVAGGPHADVLLRSLSRNNLWILEWQSDGKSSGLAFHGQGGGIRADQAFAIHGQSHSDWKTDVDFDGFDWNPLYTENEVRWDNGESGEPFFTLSPPHTFQKWSRGCAGGPRNGEYCEGDTDCQSTSPTKAYDRTNVAPFATPTPTAPLAMSTPALPYRCVAAERNYRSVQRNKIFAFNTDGAIDDYADKERFPPKRLTLDPACTGGKCAEDADKSCSKDEDCGSYCDRCAKDAGAAYPNLAEVCDGQPDLGAYELGEPTVHYGPRTPLGTEVNEVDLISSKPHCDSVE